MACQPTSSEKDPMWESCYEAVQELKDLKATQKLVDDEEQSFLKMYRIKK